MWLVLLGAPGAGKGTQAEFIKEALKVPVISTGNLLRKAINEGTEIGKIAKGLIEDGHLVPDEMVIDLIREKISGSGLSGALFDGFPRTEAQAIALDGMIKLDAAISIEVPDELIMHRMSGRRTCPDCQSTYHIEYNPPKVEGVCDKCGGRLRIRKDDKPEIIADRLQTYHKRTEPIKRYYQAQGKLKMVDGSGDIEKTRRAIFEALGVSV